MAITVYGRKSIRRLEALTSERIVHAAGPWLTTLEHGHFEWRSEANLWWPLAWATSTDCGVPLASCALLFGPDERGARVHFMRGRCRACAAGAGQRHRWDCPTLLDVLAWSSINPDYWPRPVHQPLWLGDPRRRGSHFTCQPCGRIFRQVRADAEVAAEAAAVYAPAELVDAGIVCDDCWRAMRQGMPDFDQRYRRVGL